MSSDASATDGAQITMSNEELAEQLYDMIMRDIEPDLLSYNIPKLDDYYKDETEEEHETRMQRYKVAYQRFEVNFQEFMNNVQDEVRDTKRASLTEQEAADRAEEESNLANLEEALS